MSAPLRRQILVIVGLLALPVIAAIVWSASLTLRQEQDQLRLESQGLAASTAAYLNLTVGNSSSPNLQEAQRVLTSLPLPNDAVVTVTDEHGAVIARSRDVEKYLGATGAISEPTDGPWTGVRVGVDGVRRMYTFAPIGQSGRRVAAGLPMQLAWDRTLPIYRRNLLIVGLTAITLISIALIVAWRWERAATTFERAVARVGAGDLDSFTPQQMPSREFDRLQSTFVDMIARLRSARTEVAAQVAEERRIREEMESLQRQVIRQERLAAIGVLVSGVAHELNNPLQAIYGFTEILQSRSDLPSGVVADLAVIEKESARATAIIRNLTRFGRQKNAKPAPVVLADVIASIMELRQTKLQEQNIDVVVDDAAREPVMAVFTELQQVLLNFVINAEQAMTAARPAARRLTIRTSDAKGRVHVEVEDTGFGVSPANESKLFQPFFTTKPVGEGTGLGLSVSYGIIQAYGGTIGYHRSDAGGAIFWIDLPAMQT